MPTHCPEMVEYSSPRFLSFLAWAESVPLLRSSSSKAQPIGLALLP
jgi:hypothetical protein